MLKVIFTGKKSRGRKDKWPARYGLVIGKKVLALSEIQVDRLEDSIQDAKLAYLLKDR